MENNEYSELALRTAPGVVREGVTGGSRTSSTAETEISGEQKQLLLAALGLCGEAGEVAEIVKKHIFHGHPLDFTKLVKEGGDVQWYLNYLAVRCAGTSLGAMMQANIDKLAARYPEGFFTPARSQHRALGDD